MVGEGVRNVREMARHIRIYVKNELFRAATISPSANRRYHPTLKDIRNHMYKAAVKHQFSKLDQANLDMKIQAWRFQSPNDDFFFRGYGEKVENDDIVDLDEAEDEVKVSHFSSMFVILPSNLAIRIEFN